MFGGGGGGGGGGLGGGSALSFTEARDTEALIILEVTYVSALCPSQQGAGALLVASVQFNTLDIIGEWRDSWRPFCLPFLLLLNPIRSDLLLVSEGTAEDPFASFCFYTVHLLNAGINQYLQSFFLCFAFLCLCLFLPVTDFSGRSIALPKLIVLVVSSLFLLYKQYVVSLFFIVLLFPWPASFIVSRNNNG